MHVMTTRNCALWGSGELGNDGHLGVLKRNKMNIFGGLGD